MTEPTQGPLCVDEDPLTPACVLFRWRDADPSGAAIVLEGTPNSSATTSRPPSTTSIWTVASGPPASRLTQNPRSRL